MHPLYIYFAITNSMKISGHAISVSESPYLRAAQYLAWASYGMSMGREAYIMGSERYGTPQLKLPLMLFINGVDTLRGALVTEIPA